MSKITSRLPTVVRFALGALFFVFGLDGFFHFAPHPPMAAPAADFVGALLATGYMFPLIKGTEVVSGALLLANRRVPLALTLLAPIVVNIALFHTVLQPNPGMVVFLLASEIYLAYAHRDAFRGVIGTTARVDRRQKARDERLAHA